MVKLSTDGRAEAIVQPQYFEAAGGPPRAVDSVAIPRLSSGLPDFGTSHETIQRDGIGSIKKARRARFEWRGLVDVSGTTSA